MNLVGDVWPRFAGELTDALLAAGEPRLAECVGSLEVVERCGCGDGFCQSFATAPRPEAGYGDGHRNVVLAPPWSGMLVLDVVDDAVAYVEVIDRDPLD